MTTFKKQFILLDGTQESLDIAIEKAKELGYKRWFAGLYCFTKEKDILKLDSVGDYFLTDDDKEELINQGYTELTLEPNVHYVYVSDKSVKDALREKEKRILIADLGERFNNRYITTYKNEEKKYLNGEKKITFSFYEYIAEIPQEEIIEIKTKDGQTLSITKEKAIELGFKID